MLFTAMAAAAFSTSALSIVGASIIDDLSITREQLGFLATVNIVLAALLSPRAGRIVDRIGGRRGLIATFLFGGLAFAVMGLAVAYWILVAAAVVAAISQAAGNPATNKLISRHIEEGRRGVITGVKQSGGQAASFIGGLLLPIGAETIGWRPTLLIAAGVTLALVVPTRSVVPDDRPAGITVVWGSKDLPRSVPWLAAYGRSPASGIVRPSLYPSSPRRRWVMALASPDWPLRSSAWRRSSAGSRGRDSPSEVAATS